MDFGKKKFWIPDFTAVAVIENFGNFDTLQSADQVLRQLCEVKAKEVIRTRKEPLNLLSVSFVEQYMASFCCDPVINEIPEAIMNGNSSGNTPKYEKYNKFFSFSLLILI